MGETIELTAADGHTLSAHRAGPANATKGLVVIQEIFGLNGHMRRVCEDFAVQGYAVVAPALFDRIRPGVELGYTSADVTTGRDLRTQVPDAAIMHDVAAAAAALGEVSRGIVGYCWGGTVAWWGATRGSGFRGAVGWYGGGIAGTRTEVPQCPVQLHFGEADSGIPMSDVDAIKQAQPGVEVFVYPGAGHGFGCDDRASFDRPAYEQARTRTLEFFARTL